MVLLQTYHVITLGACACGMHDQAAVDSMLCLFKHLTYLVELRSEEKKSCFASYIFPNFILFSFYHFMYLISLSFFYVWAKRTKIVQIWEQYIRWMNCSKMTQKFPLMHTPGWRSLWQDQHRWNGIRRTRMRMNLGYIANLLKQASKLRFLYLV